MMDEGIQGLNLSGLMKRFCVQVHDVGPLR